MNTKLVFPRFGRSAKEFAADFDRAMANELSAIDEIVANDRPTVENTIVVWEKAAEELSELLALFETVMSSDTTDELDALNEKYAPLFAAHSDEIYQNRALYEKIEALSKTDLDDQDRHWVELTLKDFRRSGVQLSDEDQQRLRELNSKLAANCAKWDQLVVAGRDESSVEVAGKTVELINTTGQPILAELDDREDREHIFKASTARGKTGESDVRELIIETAKLRLERAKLLGFRNHAEYVADEGTAATVEALTEVLYAVRDQAIPAAERDAKAYQNEFEKLFPGEKFEAWDWQWMAEKQRQHYAVSDEILKPYLEFERLLNDGIFAQANELYGLTFKQIEQEGYVEDARVYEVHDEDGLLGGIIVDPYARPSKQGGAWMNDLVVRSELSDKLPVVTLNCNYVKPEPGKPTLMTWDDVITIFHEFGHCLNGLFSEARYPSLAGANGPRDYVEFPSQVNEHWAWEPTLIERYAKHWQSGAQLPQELIQKLIDGAKFDQAYADTELVASMLLDQAWHTAAADELPSNPAEVDAFEAKALKAAGVDFPLIPPRYRSCYFSHIWGGGYAAAYYGYLWSELLDADACAWFDENGGLRRENGEKFRRQILAMGDSVPLIDNYAKFRGKPYDVKYLLERHDS